MPGKIPSDTLRSMRQHFLLLMILTLWLLGGCSFMGRQAPVWRSGTFTPDGKYYVYLYSIYNVSQYSQQGGITHRSGTTEYYLQVLNAVSGEKLLESPRRFDELVDIGDVSNQYVWLSSRDVRKERNSLAIFDLSALKLKFDAEEIVKLNPDIPFGFGIFYKRNAGSNQAMYEADDGRKYAVDPETGQLTPSRDAAPGERLMGYDEDFYQYENSLPGLRELPSGGSRRRLVLEDSTQITSDDDFLDPEYLTLDKQTRSDQSTPTVYEGSFFVISKVSRNQSKDYYLTRVDQQTLATIWSTLLPEDENEEVSSFSNKCRFYLIGNRLTVANQSHLMEMDLNTGSIAASYPLLPPHKF